MLLHTLRKVFKLIKSVVVFYSLYIACTAGSTLLLGLHIVLFFIVSPKFFRWIVDVSMGSWCVFAAALLETAFGIKIFVNGDGFIKDERAVILLNHRTRLDWLFFWSCFFRSTFPTTLKIVLKDVLKHMPGPGWGMQGAQFLFLKRRWEEDQIYLSTILQHFSALGHNTQFLLFPEGTDLTINTKKSSDSFADKNGLPRLQYLLHPRTTGFVFLVQQLRKEKRLDAVYDVTVAYPKNIAEKERDFISGNIPKEIHYRVTRYSLDELPETDEELAAWCQKLWLRKERLLRRAYANKPELHSHLQNVSPVSTALHNGSNPVLKGTDRAPAINDIDEDEPDYYMSSTEQKPSPRPLHTNVSLVAWSFFVVAFHWLMWCSMVARIWVLCFAVFFFAAQRYGGGFELLQARWYQLRQHYMRSSSKEH